MRWRRAIVMATVVLGILSVGAQSLVGDGLATDGASKRGATAESHKIQGSLKRLIGQAGAAGRFSVRLNRPLNGASVMTDMLAEDGFRVVVEARSEDAVNGLRATIDHLGGQIEGVAGSRLQARLSAPATEQLAEARDVAFIRLPMSPFPRDPFLTAQAEAADDEITSEGLDAIGTETWHEIGLNGQGVRVGVIDSGFMDYDKLLGSELPPEHRLTTRSFRPDNDIECSNCSETGQYHGLGTAEVVHDVAPRAELLLSNFGSGVQFERTVNWMIDQDVDVINTSLGFPSGCFRKGGGIFEPIIQKARDAGITWATSAGNEGNAHWQGTYADPDGDDRHNFAEGDNTFTVEAELVEADVNGRDAAAAILSFMLSWDAPCTGADRAYDIQIVPEDDAAETVTGSWTWQPGIPIRSAFNVFEFDADEVGETKTFQVVITKLDSEAPDVTLDMLIQACTECVDGDFDYLTPEGSVSILEPSISPSAMTVGARHHDADACGELCPDGSLLFYSSRGPTKDGRTKPDIAAPTHVSTTAFGPWNRTGDNQNVGFTGTSAASPHAAGAAALAQQAIPDGTPGEIIDFLKRRSEDLGAPGADNRFGAGALSLGPLPLDPAALNVTGVTPGRAIVGQETEAVITGTGLTRASKVLVEGSGVTATIREGATDNELPITVRVSSSAELGARSFRVVGETEDASSGRARLSVIGPPSFEVSETELAYEVTVGDRGAPIRQLSIGNRGDGPLAWSARTTQSWVAVNPRSGSTPSEIRVLLSPGDLDPGVHRAQIVLESETAENSPFRVDVVLRVQQPEIGLDPERLAFEATLGDSPDSQTVRIRNSGSGTLRWDAEPQAPWINVNASSGSGDFDLIVSIDGADLAPGTHQGTVRITAEMASNSPVEVPVIVRIQGPDALTAVEFGKIAFDPPEAWRRIVGQACVVYRNVSDGHARVHVTPPDGDDRRTYHVPSGNDVVVCGRVAHIDTRADT